MRNKREENEQRRVGEGKWSQVFTPYSGGAQWTAGREKIAKKWANHKPHTQTNEKISRNWATYSFQNADGFFTEPHGIKDVIVEDGLKQIILIVSFKRRLTGHHLVHQNTQSPPIHWWAVLQLLQDLETKTQEWGSKWCPMLQYLHTVLPKSLHLKWKQMHMQ